MPEGMLAGGSLPRHYFVRPIDLLTEAADEQRRVVEKRVDVAREESGQIQIYVFWTSVMSRRIRIELLQVAAR